MSCLICHNFDPDCVNDSLFTRIELTLLRVPLPGLVCIQCQKCVALSRTIQPLWVPVDRILDSGDRTKNGWLPDDSFGWIHSILNRVVYRINEPPRQDSFECDYADPDPDIDSILILWHSGRAVGFCTLREAGRRIPGSNNIRFELPVVDTVFVRSAARGRGFTADLIDVLLQRTTDLGFSDPVSDGMFVVLLRYLKDRGPNRMDHGQDRMHSGPDRMDRGSARERLWLVSGSGTEKKNLWWSVPKVARDRNINVKAVLKARS